MGIARKVLPLIPGETPVDLSGLKDKSIRTRKQLNAVEAENIRRATLKYLASPPPKKVAPFTYSWFLRLHKEMFGDVWDWAGEIRTQELTIGIPWRQIGESLGGLALDIEYWTPFQETILEQAVDLHYRAVRIHPFQNGNGRWSRMLSNIWLLQHKSQMIEWPEAEVGSGASSVRQEYIAAIRLADSGDFSKLIALHKIYWRESS